jgi:hypothetical protein
VLSLDTRSLIHHGALDDHGSLTLVVLSILTARYLATVLSWDPARSTTSVLA